MYANYHVSEYLDYNNLTGFIKTISPNDDYVPTRKDIFALDCEMCYTTAGLELTRVTVVDINRKIVYDALVKPDNKIIDYNTTYVDCSHFSFLSIIFVFFLFLNAMFANQPFLFYLFSVLQIY